MIRTHASLFSGIGGAEIAASWMGWSNVFHCEIQEFPRRVLEYFYPNSKSYEDITKTDFTEWRGKIDVLTAGFPCQPFSLAGQRRGADDDRYLWPEALRAIREVQPSWFVGENVAGLVTMVQPGEDVALGRTDDIFEENHIYRKEQRFTLDEICEGLEREGYAVQPFVIPACAVGAPHRRDRIWIVARRFASDTYGNGRQEEAQQQRGKAEKIDGQPKPVLNTGASSHRADAGAENQCGRKDGVHAAGLAADADINRQRKRTNEQELLAECKSTSYNSYGGEIRPAADAERERLERSEGDGVRWKQPRLADAGLPSDRWADFPTQSPVCSRDDGISLGLAGITFPRWRAEAVKALGNAMVSQVVYEIFRAIEKVENNEDADI